jgi:tRNA(Ile)-lysidine synthetase-like protein
MPDDCIILRRHGFVKGLAAALRERCGVEPGTRLLLAVSGGADSVALLRGLAALADRREWRLDLHVGHIQHHLRPDAETDADFVEQLAADLGLPFHRRDVHPAAEAGNLEAAARRRRYRALREIAGRLDAECIVTAHHADDQLETMLMRLIRGASVRGLAGMAWRRRLGGRQLIRPMLGTDHAAAMAFCRAIDQRWREDPSNRDAERWRARLREAVLPVLRELRPDAANKANDAAQQLRETAACLERAARRAERRLVTLEDGNARLDRDAARALPRPLLRTILRDRLRQAGAPTDRLGQRQLDPIVRAIRDRGGERRRFDLAGLNVTVAADQVHIEPKTDAPRAQPADR